MEKKYITLTGVLAAALLVASPVAADEHNHLLDGQLGLRIKALVGVEGPKSAEVMEQKMQLIQEFKAEHREAIRAKLEEKREEIREQRKEGHAFAKRVRAALADGSAQAGVVTNVHGPVFTIDPIGLKNLVTVVTNASTTFFLNGAATTSSALEVGSRVFLSGTTTATSSEADSFTASVVKIFTEGFGKMKLWFSVR